ncbi:MAG TPA: ACP S-malonyltransferase [Clostridia bacterium]|nr:ACP S-malonyltransferase [Clostridia bacterium]
MQGKIAFVFPGQGSQYPGMGRELYENYLAARRVFEEADAVAPLSRLCFAGSEEELRQTVNTQPAVLTASVAAYRVLQSFGIKADFAAGHSLGEYAALVAAGVLRFKDALQIVITRSRLMEQAVPQGTGGMAAVLGLGAEAVTEVCREASQKSPVEPANFNCPGQVVIAGYIDGVNAAMELAKARGAKRVIPLNVSGPFHSSLMEPAGRKLQEELSKFSFHTPEIPVVANVSAAIAGDPETIRFNLAQQVYRPVRWEESVRFLYRQGVRIFIEVGPGKVLTGLIKKTLKDVLLLNVEDEASLQLTLQELKEVG